MECGTRNLNNPLNSLIAYFHLWYYSPKVVITYVLIQNNMDLYWLTSKNLDDLGPFCLYFSCTVYKYMPAD